MIKKLSFLVLLFAMAFLASCDKKGDDVLAGNGSETDNAMIKGHLYYENGQPAVRAVVRFVTADHTPVVLQKAEAGEDTAMTDQNGEYRVAYLSSNTYNIFGEDRTGLVSLRDSVHITGSDTVLKPDTLKQAGEIRGISFMAGQNDTNQIRMTIFMPGTRFLRKPQIGGAFNFSNVPEGKYTLIFDPTLNDYSVKILEINVRSGQPLNLDTVYIYSTNITGRPVANAGTDTTVSINDTIHLHGSATDPFGRIAQYEWAVGLFGVFHTSRADTVFNAPGRRDSSLYCILRVKDNDGNIGLDTVLVSVRQDPPYAVIQFPFYCAPGDTAFLTTTASDSFGEIITREWDIGGTGKFTPTSKPDTFFVIPPTSPDSIPVVFRVMDDDSNVFAYTAFIATVQKDHVFWYKCITNNYNLQSNPGPNLSPLIQKHEGMVVSAQLNQRNNALDPNFIIGSGLDDAQGRCGVVWFKDLCEMTGRVSIAKIRAEFRDGWIGNALCNAGSITIRCGVADFQGNIDEYGGVNNVPTTATWADGLYPLAYAMGFNADHPTSLMSEDTISLMAPAGRQSETDDPLLDKQFMEVEITNQVNWILAHTGANKGSYSGQYAIVFLVDVGKGSTGKINTYGAENCVLPIGGDVPWTTDGNTMHLFLKGGISPIQ